MDNHNINIRVYLDNEKMPEHIQWNAGEADSPQHAKAVLLSLWDGSEKTALRIDLWTKKMMVDEMNDFFFQTLYGMAETYQRATNNETLAKELKKFAKDFHEKAIKIMEEEEQNN